MARPIWKGAVSFGLVTIPVGLYAATERRAEIAFRQLHKKDHAPIQYKRVCTERLPKQRRRQDIDLALDVDSGGAHRWYARTLFA